MFIDKQNIKIYNAGMSNKERPQNIRKLRRHKRPTKESTYTSQLAFEPLKIDTEAEKSMRPLGDILSICKMVATDMCHDRTQVDDTTLGTAIEWLDDEVTKRIKYNQSSTVKNRQEVAERRRILAGKFFGDTLPDTPTEEITLTSDQDMLRQELMMWVYMVEPKLAIDELKIEQELRLGNYGFETIPPFDNFYSQANSLDDAGWNELFGVKDRFGQPDIEVSKEPESQT